mmetsp:Transcript_22744/g.70493  ORF Transcript_22744/g.70493 Transcript_22744/m.70493 type:complete len:298 (-) Transcript_22744:275-1168(-)
MNSRASSSTTAPPRRRTRAVSPAAFRPAKCNVPSVCFAASGAVWTWPTSSTRPTAAPGSTTMRSTQPLRASTLRPMRKASWRSSACGRPPKSATPAATSIVHAKRAPSAPAAASSVSPLAPRTAITPRQSRTAHSCRARRGTPKATPSAGSPFTPARPPNPATACACSGYMTPRSTSAGCCTTTPASTTSARPAIPAPSSLCGACSRTPPSPCTSTGRAQPRPSRRTQVSRLVPASLRVASPCVVTAVARSTTAPAMMARWRTPVPLRPDLPSAPVPRSAAATVPSCTLPAGTHQRQ